jgi:hypothetical protein
MSFVICKVFRVRDAAKRKTSEGVMAAECVRARTRVRGLSGVGVCERSLCAVSRLHSAVSRDGRYFRTCVAFRRTDQAHRPVDAVCTAVATACFKPDFSQRPPSGINVSVRFAVDRRWMVSTLEMQ